MSDILARRLADRAAEVLHRSYERLFLEELDELLAAPLFDTTGDWHDFVDPAVQKIWPQLDKAARLAVYLTALQAHRSTTAKSIPPDHPPYHGVRD